MSLEALKLFWADTPVRAVRRGRFWIAGERVTRENKTYQRGPMFVEWEAPERVRRPYPVVLVHGGGFQGTEWFDTPDGRPGWAQRLVEAGYAALVVDRPGHGRSPLHPDIVGPAGPPFSYGPAILITHSASGPSCWLAADRRPGLIRAIVSVEPMGPPFADIPNIGHLSWGLTAAPLTFDPPQASPEAVRKAGLATLRLPNLAGLPVAVVTGDTSAFAPASPPILAALQAGGAAAEPLHLPDHGVTGNGHGLIYELNSDAALKPVLDWLDRHAGQSSSEGEG